MNYNNEIQIESGERILNRNNQQIFLGSKKILNSTASVRKLDINLNPVTYNNDLLKFNLGNTNEAFSSHSGSGGSIMRLGREVGDNVNDLAFQLNQ